MLKKDFTQIAFRVTEEKKEKFSIRLIKDKTTAQEVLSDFVDYYLEHGAIKPAKNKKQ